MGMTTPELAARGAMRDQALSAGTVGAIGIDMTQTQETMVKLQNGDRIYLGHAGNKALVAVIADGSVTMTHGDTVTAKLDLATLPKDVEAALLRGKAANAESKSKNCSLYAGRI